MVSAHAIPLIILSTLIELLFGLTVWRFWRAKRHEGNNTLPGSRDDVLLGLLVLGAFVMGVLLSYALLYFSFS